MYDYKFDIEDSRWDRVFVALLTVAREWTGANLPYVPIWRLSIILHAAYHSPICFMCL